MAYNTATPAVLTSEAPLTGTGQRWYHTSADAAAAVDTAGFITNANSLGLKVGDLLTHRDSGTGIFTNHRVVAIATNGSADLGDGTVVGATTNTD
jgi:hypothetical protein